MGAGYQLLRLLCGLGAVTVVQCQSSCTPHVECHFGSQERLERVLTSFRNDTDIDQNAVCGSDYCSQWYVVEALRYLPGPHPCRNEELMGFARRVDGCATYSGGACCLADECISRDERTAHCSLSLSLRGLETGLTAFVIGVTLPALLMFSEDQMALPWR